MTKPFRRDQVAAMTAAGLFDRRDERVVEAARKLAARAVIVSDQIDTFINTVTSAAVPIPGVMIAGLHEVAAKLRAEAEAARAELR